MIISLSFISIACIIIFTCVISPYLYCNFYKFNMYHNFICVILIFSDLFRRIVLKVQIFIPFSLLRNVKHVLIQWKVY